MRVLCFWARRIGDRTHRSVCGVLSRRAARGLDRARGCDARRSAGVRDALGYEDSTDHDELRDTIAMAVLAGKLAARREDCAPVAGKSTANRLELSKLEPTRYHKISHNPVAIKNLLVDQFVEAHARPPKQIILDLDATDDPLHGEQEGRFFTTATTATAICRSTCSAAVTCWSPNCGAPHMMPAAGAVEEVARVIARIRAPLAVDTHSVARGQRLRAGGPDGLVRGQRRRLSVWAGAQRAAGRRDCDRA